MILSTKLNHPLRLPLAGEVHARPFVHMEGPVRVTHLAVFQEGLALSEHLRLLTSLCERFSVPGPAAGAVHYFHDFGAFRLKWERHTEFSTYTLIEDGESVEPFSSPPIRHVPHDWLVNLTDKLLVALQIAVEKGEPIEPGHVLLKQSFRPSPLVGSRVLANGEVWTDFQVAPDGYSHILVRDTGLRETQTGRLVQRLCEIETYRMMAFLALPIVREQSQLLNEAEAELSNLSKKLSSARATWTEEQLLQDLAGLAVRIQAMALQGNFRFGAAQAYFELVEARISELRESRIEGVPTIGEFVERRVVPAASTCTSGAQRLSSLSTKVAQVIGLLQTRVSIRQEQQNQAVLNSLNKNSEHQLRLQQAVEGLSVVAITYYATSLVGYLLKASKSLGLNISVEVLTGLLLPLIFSATWFGLKRFQARGIQDQQHKIS